MPGTQGQVFGVGGPRVKVTVTENDVRWATREDSSRCMVARALAREVDDAHRIEVDTQTIRFTTAKGRFAYLTPLAVQRYVASFDAGEPVEPFEFTLRNPLRVKQKLRTPEQNAEYRVRQLTEDRNTPPSVPSKRPTAYNTPGDILSPPRVFKTKKRTYGQRQLRINQPIAATALDELRP